MVVFHNLTALSSQMTSYEVILSICHEDFNDKTIFPLRGHVDWRTPGTSPPYPYLYPFLRYSKTDTSVSIRPSGNTAGINQYFCKILVCGVFGTHNHIFDIFY